VDNWSKIPFSKIKSVKTKWLLPAFIPRGVITALAGEGGVGKSTCIMDLIGRVTTGNEMPQIGGEVHEDPPLMGSALIICKEDDPARITKARLEAAGADMNKVYTVVIGRPRLPEDLEVIDSLDAGVDRLERIIQDIGDVRIILIDPITSFVGSKGMYNDNKVRELLNPLAQLAARYDLAIISVIHMNKDMQKKGNQRVLGSGAFVNVARTVLFVAPTIEKSTRRYLMVGKTNLWPDKMSVEFAMTNVDGQAQIEWGADYEDLDFEEVLSGKSRHRTKGDEAAIALRRWLAEEPMSAVEIRQRFAEIGISPGTFKIAKKEIGVASEKRSDGSWWWSLPRE
jgi:putative DNA primase/helicase